jgi:hypothetical protein
VYSSATVGGQAGVESVTIVEHAHDRIHRRLMNARQHRMDGLTKICRGFTASDDAPKATGRDARGPNPRL